MRVKVGKTIEIENPSAEILRWAKATLTVANPEYAKKLRMNFWLGNTPSHITFYEVRGNTLVLPYGTLRNVLPMIDFDNIELSFAPSRHINYDCNIPLYDYQEAALNALVRSQYGILQSPAGSGKTQIGIALIARLGKRALWLTHTKDLLDQSKDRAEMYIDKSLLGTITEGKVNIGSGITFATIQTMSKLNLESYQNFWDVIVVDECHRCAGSPTVVTQFYKVLSALAAKNKYGLSATVHRSDGLIVATKSLLGDIVYEVDQSEVKDKIMQIGIQPIGTGVKISPRCQNSDGTLNFTHLITYLCENQERNKIIVRQLEKHSQFSSLILSDRLNHLETLISMLPAEMREQAAMISGKMTTKVGKQERKQAIEDMRSGRKKYLFATYSLAKEGLDIPCLERLYMATPQKDYAVITQSIGRIARTCEGKKEPICYDFVDDILYLYKAYKKRCTTYKKNNCYFATEE